MYDQSNSASANLDASGLSADSERTFKFPDISGSLSAIVATADLTAQSAAIAATTLLAVAKTGHYRISWSATITTAASTSSVLGGTQ